MKIINVHEIREVNNSSFFFNRYDVGTALTCIIYLIFIMNQPNTSTKNKLNMNFVIGIGTCFLRLP